MADVRFTLDAHQVKLVHEFMELFLEERPQGEALNMVWSITEVLAVKFGKRMAERRLEHKFIMPVYQALALRRLVSSGMEYHGQGAVHDELRRVLAVVDEKTTLYTVIN